MSFKIREVSLDDIEAITELRIELQEVVGDVNEKNRIEVDNANRNYFKEKISTGEFSNYVVSKLKKDITCSAMHSR